MQEVLDGLAYLSPLVNLSPRLKIVAPFAYQRANGITAHPELREAFEQLKQATPSRPSFLAVGAPEPEPEPEPEPQPEPEPMPKNIPPISDDEIIELAAFYDACPPQRTKADDSYLRDAAYYGCGYMRWRAYGDSHADAAARYQAAAQFDLWYEPAPPGMMPDPEIISLSERWTARYRKIGRYQMQSRFEKGRDLTYWLIVYARARDVGRSHVAALQIMERGMNAEAGLPDPFPGEQPPAGGTGIAGPIRVSDRSFLNAAGTFRPLFVSSFGTLGQLIHDRTVEARDYMRWAKATGFNGLRFFAGNLDWMDGQTAGDARQVLPAAMVMARDEELYVEVTALTGTRAAPTIDKPAHVRVCGSACVDAGNGILEVANEPYHSSQDDETHKAENLREWGSLVSVPFALGAAEIDETGPDGVYPMAGGSYITIHLRRGQIWFVQMMRVREQENVSAVHRVSVMNGEPVGWDEPDTARVRDGSRLSNPEAFFLLGASSRVMEVGICGHGEHALRSEIPGPNQQACAEALVRGVRAVERAVGTADRLTFKNGHWADCPAGGTFVNEAASERPGHPDRVWRIHAGVSGNRAAVILGGFHGDPGLFWREGWREVAVIDEMPNVRILSAER